MHEITHVYIGIVYMCTSSAFRLKLMKYSLVRHSVLVTSVLVNHTSQFHENIGCDWQAQKSRPTIIKHYCAKPSAAIQVRQKQCSLQCCVCCACKCTS